MIRNELVELLTEHVRRDYSSVTNRQVVEKVLSFLENRNLVQNLEPEEKPKKKVTVWTWEYVGTDRNGGYFVSQMIASEQYMRLAKNGWKKVPGSERVIEVENETK